MESSPPRYPRLVKLLHCFLRLRQTVFILIADAVKKINPKLEDGYKDFFGKYPAVRWFMFIAGLLLIAYSVYQQDLHNLLTSVVITILCIPVKSLFNLPTIPRYFTVGLLLVLQLAREN
ncbi:MAG: hypothetical protein ACRC2V_13985 [Xenococcaceae cyanobacterium]